jgi:hypothetical protein
MVISFKGGCVWAALDVAPEKRHGGGEGLHHWLGRDPIAGVPSLFSGFELLSNFGLRCLGGVDLLVFSAMGE